MGVERGTAWAIAIVGMMLLSGAVAVIYPAAGSTERAVQSHPASLGLVTPRPMGPSLPSAYAPPVVYHGPTPQHLPRAWGSQAAPPGAPTTFTASAKTTCVGKWPFGGQSLYSNQCIGHDEPAINPYSDLPGSGGNVSWNVSLPVDAGPTHNQSDVYIAIWFGMNLNDPFGYNGQCFLELQMYPDTAGSGAVQNGVWSAFAVAWQIQLSNGFEDPCYAAGLNEPNGTPLQMNQGDHLYVNMTGWQGSKSGENISVVDTTLGVTSQLTLYNTQNHYPLNPAYLANDVQDALPWSPGGDLPVSFAFESGHTTDDPQNDTFGGCNSGVPPANPLDGAIPCGSYSPRDWAMDTKVPWHFYPVEFFHAATRVTAVQYGFEQDFGASAWIDGLSGGTCDGRDGSAYCSYPWYSYAASLNAFEFGATDFVGTTDDFGTYAEYGSTLQTDSSGLNFYPIQNFSLPTPGGHALRLSVSGAGSVYFLHSRVTGSATFRHLEVGAYSINAVPAAGQYFRGYTTSGSVSLDAAGPGWNTVDLSGGANVTAVFGPTPPTPASVTFQDSGHHGFVTVVPGFAFQLGGLLPSAGPGFGLAPVFRSSATDVASGTTLSLAPGIYSVQAAPDPGYKFTGWSASSGVYVFAPATNYTWINVTSAGGTVHAQYQATPLTATVWLASYPSQGGQIRFANFTYSSGAVFSASVGTFPVQAIAAPGFRFLTWSPGFMSTMTNWSSSTHLLLQRGNDYLTAVFASAPVLSLPRTLAGGAFAINGTAVVGNISLPQVGNVTYQLEAVTNPGFSFTNWTVTSPSAAWVFNSSSAITSIQVNGSTTLSPHFVRHAASASVGFFAHSGAIRFDANRTFSGTSSTHLTPGTFVIAPVAPAGESFEGWNTTGSVHVTTTYILTTTSMADVENSAGEWVAWYAVTVAGSGTVSAVFGTTTHPVTFIDSPFRSAFSVSVTGGTTARTIHAGDTVLLPSGIYTLTLLGGTISGLRWFANSNLTFAPGAGTPTTLTVSGSGTIYAVG